MLTSFLRRARVWMAPPTVRPEPFDCLPVWSEPMAEQHAAIWWRVKPYTMASAEGVVAICQSIAYIENQRIPGAIVECGVGKAGGVMTAALALLALDSTHRSLHLYDTFDGMPAPSDLDVNAQGRQARDLLRGFTPDAERLRVCSSLDVVKQAMMLTRYPWEKLSFNPGRVETTLPRQAPDQISLLHLDANWHDSTAHTLEHLYPRLADGGVLILENHGQSLGARKAVDDYFRQHASDAELRVINDSGRLLVKKARVAVHA